jgi:membrane protease YdiL (CAAX protease family)
MTQGYWFYLTGTLLLTIVIGYMTYMSAQVLRHWRPDRNLLLLPVETLMRLLLIALCLGLGWLSGLGPTQLGWVWPEQTNTWLVALAWGGLVAGCFIIATPWVIKRTGEMHYSAVIVDAIVPRNQRELWLVALAMIPVVVLEELLFRSLLIGGLAPVLPVTLLVVGWSILFGLLHSPQGQLGMAGATIAGVLLGWLFLTYGTLAAPLIAHYAINIIQLVFAMRQRAATVGADVDR